MDQAAQVREKIDIVSFISDYIQLKKAGRNFKANCPFHNEKTPSFVVSPERQIWHCFGCAKGGDVFNFLMEYEHMDFPEALRILAKKAGIVLKENFDRGMASKREKIFDLNQKAANFYSFILTKHPAGKKALDYLIDKRGMTIPLIETFKLGFSPTLGHTLSDYLMKKKNYKKQDLYEAGLSFERRGAVSDFFKGRIIFPLTDHRGNIVGFSGRVLDDKGDGPKYINTKDTIVYHKGSLFFGLDNAKDEIKKLSQAVLMEGEFDVISSFKEGIKNAIAVKGTALTEEQVALLSRFTPKITMCLDKDEAGFEAMRRSLAILEKRGFITTIVVPDGKDPDEAVRKNPYGFKKAIKEDIGVYDFLIEKTVSENKKDALGKKKISDFLLPLFAQIENEVLKEHYLKFLSEKMGTSYESLAKETEKIKSGRQEEKIAITKRLKRSRREILEEYLLSLIVQNKNPKVILEKVREKIGKIQFEQNSIGKIFDHLSTFFKSHDKFDSKKFTAALPKELLTTFDKCFLLPLPKFEEEERYYDEAEKSSSELIELFLRDKIKNLREEIKKASEDSKKNLEKELSQTITLLPKSS